MNQIENLKKLNNLSYFDKNTISQFIQLSDNSLYANIKRWIKSGLLIQLKKGLYVTSDFMVSIKQSTFYTEFIANKLREPSYLSMEYVLQKHNILTEAVYGFTSVTLKSKYTYTNSFGVFVYRNIKAALFEGYTIKTGDHFAIKVATKAKALFDYFYYKLFRVTVVDAPVIKSFRLNYDEISKDDLVEFERYCTIAGTRKMRQVVRSIEQNL